LDHQTKIEAKLDEVKEVMKLFDEMKKAMEEDTSQEFVQRRKQAVVDTKKRARPNPKEL
jgi:hypothetical protein